MKRLKSFVFLIFILFFCFSPAQKGTILENISESEGLPSNYIFNVQEDHNNTLWFGTDKGLLTYVDDKWIALDVDNGMPGNYINKMAADNKKGLLISIYDKGLFFFNTNSKTLEIKYKEIARNQSVDLKKATIKNDFIIVKLLNQNPDKIKYYAFDRRNINHLSKVKKVKLNHKEYFALENGILISDANIFENLNIYNFRKHSFELKPFGIIRRENNKIIDTITEENGLASNLVSQILGRKNGDVFITTLNGGISILKENNAKKSFHNKTFNVRNVVFDQQKKYILADGYLYSLNEKEIESKVFLKKNALTFLISGNELFLGSFDGLEIYDIKPKLKLKKKIPITMGISKIIKINQKIIYSTYGNGIFVLEKNNLINYRNQYFNNIENIFKTKNGFAITSYEDGVCLLDSNFNVIKHFDKRNGLESNYATAVYYDNDSIFIGTKKGATIFYKNIRVYSFNEDHNFKGNVVLDVFRDRNGNVWVLTDKCLYKKIFNKFMPFGTIRLTENKEDRILRGSFSYEKNELVAVTKNKFSIIKLDKIVPQKHIVPVILEKIISDNKLINPNDDIQFNDNDKNIYFVFKSVDKEILTQTKLYYRINKEP